MSKQCEYTHDSITLFGPVLITLSSVASGTDERIIAPENVEIVQDESQITGRMFPLAGKYFKRFDRDSCCFISNIDEEFPGLVTRD